MPGTCTGVRGNTCPCNTQDTCSNHQNTICNCNSTNEQCYSVDYSPPSCTGVDLNQCPDFNINNRCNCNITECNCEDRGQSYCQCNHRCGCNQLKDFDPREQGIGRVSGNVYDAITGTPIPNATVSLQNSIEDPNIIDVTTTDQNGYYHFGGIETNRNYTLGALHHGYTKAYLNFTGDNTYQQNHHLYVSEILLPNYARIVLSWTVGEPEGVRDLDAHLKGPRADSPNNRFHVYYNRRIYSHDNVIYAQLDLDNISFPSDTRPETITLLHVTPGIYRYYVHRFSTGNIYNANPTINFYHSIDQSETIQLQSADPPIPNDHKSRRIWKALEIEVNANSEMTYEIYYDLVEDSPE